MVYQHFILTFLLYFSLSGTLYSQLNNSLNPLEDAQYVVKHGKISADGKEIVFAANYNGRFAIYKKTRNLSEWGKPQLIAAASTYQGKTGEIDHPAFNYNNTRIYYSARYDSLDADYNLYYIQRNGSGWSAPIPLSPTLNSSQHEYSPTISQNDKLIMFTRYDPESGADEYCYTIYYSELQKDGTWNTPKPLPAPFNSGCEQTPFIAPDNHTFYFATFRDLLNEENRVISKKSFNIVQAKYEDGLFYYPSAVQELVNEDIFQFSPSVSNNGNNIYFCEGDLYDRREDKRYAYLKAAPLPAGNKPEQQTLIYGKVKDQNGEGLDVDIIVSNPNNFIVYHTYKIAKPDGSFFFYLPPDRDYTIEFRKKDYSTVVRSISTASQSVEINTSLFNAIDVNFNVFDKEIFHPVAATLKIIENGDTVMVAQTDSTGKTANSIPLKIGKKYTILSQTEHYHTDTFKLDLATTIVFRDFDIDLDMIRTKKSIKLQFSDDESNSVTLDLMVHNLTRNEVIKTTVKDGEVDLELREGEVYQISTTARGYSYFTTTFDLKEESADTLEQQPVKVEMNKISDKESIQLDNIFFEVNSIELSSKSYEELQKLAEFLIDNGDYLVEIGAHTDDTGSDFYNMRLSQKRAQSVVNFLSERSIEVQRLIAKGYGESTPLVANSSEENRAMNRRVEFKILNIDETSEE